MKRLSTKGGAVFDSPRGKGPSGGTRLVTLGSNRLVWGGGSNLLPHGLLKVSEIKLLNQVSFRNIKCTCCRKLMPSTHFYQKAKGLEGPLRKYWAKKDSFCKSCSLNRKAQKYKNIKRQTKQNTLRRINLNTLDVNSFKVVTEDVPDATEQRVGAYIYLFETILKGDL